MVGCLEFSSMGPLHVTYSCSVQRCRSTDLLHSYYQAGREPPRDDNVFKPNVMAQERQHLHRIALFQQRDHRAPRLPAQPQQPVVRSVSYNCLASMPRGKNSTVRSTSQQRTWTHPSAIHPRPGQCNANQDRDRNNTLRTSTVDLQCRQSLLK
jgi:hypothetical protein